MQKKLAAPLHVLIVDDDVFAGRALARIIESEGHKATVLTDPTDALRTARKLSIDVLISDERMPGMTGTEILGTLARLRPETFRVLMSCALSGEKIVELVNEARLDYLLSKPFRIEQIRTLLRTAQTERRTSHKAPRSCVFGWSSLPRDSTGAIVVAA